MGLITFRIAMVLSVLRIMEDGCFDKTLLCMDTDFETALTMAEVLLQHTGKVIRELPKVASTPSGSGQKTVLTNCHRNLSAEILSKLLLRSVFRSRQLREMSRNGAMKDC